jgi:hypothetical protein
MKTEISESGRKSMDIICIANKHNYRISKPSLSNIKAVAHMKTKPGHGKYL